MSTKAIEALKSKAQAVIDRWDSPLWKDLPHTGESINELRKALAELEAQGGQAGEPVAWVVKKPGGYCDVGYDSRKLNEIPSGTKLYTHPQPSPSEVPPWPPTPEMLDALRTGSRKDFPSDELCRVRYAALRAAIQAQQAKGA